MTNLYTFSKQAAAISEATKRGASKEDAATLIEHVGMTYQLDLDALDLHLAVKGGERNRTVAEPHPDALSVELDGDLDQIQACGYSHCPHCGIHLSNGLMDFDSLADQHGDKEARSLQKREWACMGCGEDWGTLIGRGGKAKNEPLRHYSNKSDVELKTKGGAVKVCWDLFIANPEMKRKDAIAAAVEQGVTFYTARTQYQKWFQAHKASKAARA